MKFNKRELFLLAAALRYAQTNLDDMNEVFRDEEEPSIIKVQGGDLFGTDIEQWELLKLTDRVVEKAINKARKDKK